MLHRRQIAVIHVAKNRLGLDDATYRAVLKQYGGVSSARFLTRSAFLAVMRHFEACGFKTAQGAARVSGLMARENTAAQDAGNPKHATRSTKQETGDQKADPRFSRDGYLRHLAKWQALGVRPGMATAPQLAHIEALWDEMQWYWNHDGRGDRKAALSGLLQRLCGVQTLRFVSFDDAARVIDCLKGIQGRKEQGEERSTV